MTPINLMEDLANFIETANKDYFLTDDIVKNSPLIVSAGHLPIRDDAKEVKTPSITVTVINIEDAVFDNGGGQSVANVRLYFNTYNEDLKKGWKEIYNLMEHTRQALLKQRTISDKFLLQLPLKSAFPEPIEQPDALWSGVMEAKYIIAQPKEVTVIDGIKY